MYLDCTRELCMILTVRNIYVTGFAKRFFQMHQILLILGIITSILYEIDFHATFSNVLT